MRENARTLIEACRLGVLEELLDEYVESCYPRHSEGETDGARQGSKRKAETTVRFPNVAGFCRYVGCSADALYALSDEYPEELERIRTVLEDEALNASMSPTVIAAYLKRRLGYEKESARTGAGEVRVCFEHDIWEDGE